MSRSFKIVKTLESTFDPCLVCGDLTNKLHLQVNVCYACAAFFRRSVLTHQNYRCQNINGRCNTTIKRPCKKLCRYCRYKKCVEVGLIIKKMSQTKFNNSIKMSYQSILPINDVFSEISSIFEEPFGNNANLVINFTDELSNFLASFKPSTSLVPCKAVDENLQQLYYQAFFIESARLFSKNHTFAALPLADKLILHQKFWDMLNFFIAWFHSCRIFGSDEKDLRLALNQYQYVDASGLPSLYNIDNNSPAGLHLLKDVMEQSVRSFREFKKANFTFYEFSYLCQVVLWSCYDYPILSSSTRYKADIELQQISQALHQYYTETLKLSMYAARQARIYRIARLIKDLKRNFVEVFWNREVFYFGMEKFEISEFHHKVFKVCNNL